MNTLTPELKSKLSKILALQKSSNVNEAANAAALVEKLCKEWDISPSDIDGYDPEKDEAIEWAYGKTFKKQDPAISILISSVSKYYNGSTYIGYAPYKPWTAPSNIRRQLHIIATEGNRLQIELYAEYLIDVMEDLAKEAKKANPDTPIQYKQNYRKGFAFEIASRLREMKAKQEKEGKPESNTPALVVINRNTLERNTVDSYKRLNHPSMRSGNKVKLGTGTKDGREAASSVGLNKQVQSETQLALKAASTHL